MCSTAVEISDNRTSAPANDMTGASAPSNDQKRPTAATAIKRPVSKDLNSLPRLVIWRMQHREGKFGKVTEDLCRGVQREALRDCPSQGPLHWTKIRKDIVEGEAKLEVDS